MFGSLFKGRLGEKVTQFGLWQHLDEQVYRRFHDVIGYLAPALRATARHEVRNSGDSLVHASITSRSSSSFCVRGCVSPDFPSSETTISTHAWRKARHWFKSSGAQS